MKDLPTDDRPREKLTRAGAAALGDNELVAIVLGTGTRGRDVLAVAHDVLRAAGGTQGLARLCLDELRAVDGVGTARAARVLSAVELGRRVLVREAGHRPQFRSPEDVAQFLMPQHGTHRVEQFGAVLLDTRHRLIRTAVLSIGATDGSIAQPREVFREALLASAASVVVFHNHPSGDPQPSADDIAVTTRLVQVGETMGIPVIDHIILGAGRYYSFKMGNRLT
ncbi:MAG: DNA repair protein RadC [Acidobacteria bacterium]|nr:DNA repair protein RadC [Acidobacteriota bacterium]